MNYKVVITGHFNKEAKQLCKKYASLKSEIEKIIISLESDPVAGTPIGKNCYKI